jgi:hypothetical protein
MALDVTQLDRKTERLGQPRQFLMNSASQITQLDLTSRVDLRMFILWIRQPLPAACFAASPHGHLPCDTVKPPA